MHQRTLIYAEILIYEVSRILQRALKVKLLNKEQERLLDSIERDGTGNGVEWCCRNTFSKLLETSNIVATWEQPFKEST